MPVIVSVETAVSLMAVYVATREKPLTDWLLDDEDELLDEEEEELLDEDEEDDDEE